MELVASAMWTLLLNLIMIFVGVLAAERMRGINRSGTEYACVQNNGIFEGPVDDRAIDAMRSWKVNVVRVPLNEECWLGINGYNEAFIGENYRSNISDYVSRLRRKGLKVILDLHWSGGLYGGEGQGSCYDEKAKCQKPMPDRKNAPNFWKSMAQKFGKDQGVIFDLFNEPFPDMVLKDKAAAWKCWRDGGDACPGFMYTVAGMQELVDAVRGAGGENLLMLGGLTWANDLSQWKQHVPRDKKNRLAVSWHSYNFNACNQQECWEQTVAPLAKSYPVIVGEIGEHGCTHQYIDRLMTWLDSKAISYLGWTWNTWDCDSGPALITNYDGTPTEYGKGLKARLSKK